MYIIVTNVGQGHPKLPLV